MDKLITRRPEEYQVGQLYYIQDAHDATKFLITTCSGVADDSRIKGRYITNFEGEMVFASEETTPYVIDRPSRLATFEELKWYTACVRADKFVPRNSTYPSDRVIPTEKSYIITEEQLRFIYENSGLRMRDKLEEWYNFDMFHEKVGGNGE